MSRRFGTPCSETSENKIQTPGNHPKERVNKLKISLFFTCKRSNNRQKRLVHYKNTRVRKASSECSSQCHWVPGHDPSSNIPDARSMCTNLKFFPSLGDKSSRHVWNLVLTVRVVSLILLKPTGHVMHQQFNIQQLYVLSTLHLCVLYLSENKQRLVPLTA